MRAKKIDELFKRKIYDWQSGPSPDSWDKLEAMLDEKPQRRNITVWKVAAVVALLIASVFAVMLVTHHPAPTEIIATTGNTTISPVVPEIDQQFKVKANSEIAYSEITLIPTKEKRAKKAVNAEAIMDENHPNLQSIVMKAPVGEIIENPIRVNDLEDRTPRAELAGAIAPSMTIKKRNPIRITYKRGNPLTMQNDQMMAQAIQDSVKKRTLKSIWDSSKDLNATEIWADIRQAKDNLFTKDLDRKKTTSKTKN